MLIISHRGNIDGPSVNDENRPDYIDHALEKNFEVEIDIWLINNEIYLGHDEPLYKINKNWLFERRQKTWIHCKNFDSLSYLSASEESKYLNFFFHQKDQYTLTSKNYIWVYPSQPYDRNSVIVSRFPKEFKNYIKDRPYGVCTDFPNELNLIINNK